MTDHPISALKRKQHKDADHRSM